jgi:hypothetical protein
LQQGLLAIDVIRSVLWSPSKYKLVAKPLIGTAMGTKDVGGQKDRLLIGVRPNRARHRT